MQPTTHSDYTVAPTPDITDLDTVEPLPFDIETEYYANTHDVFLSEETATAVFSELWRLSRNPRLLELAIEARNTNHLTHLQLSYIASHNIEDGVLDPTVVAQQFITTALQEIPVQVAQGHTPIGTKTESVTDSVRSDPHLTG